jgi:hypothetical protein
MRARCVVAGLLCALGWATSARAFMQTSSPVPWSLLEVSPTGRWLSVGVVGGGCDMGLRVTGTETPTTVRLDVQMLATVPDGPNEGCTSDIRRFRSGALLTRPLAGRQLVDQWRIGMFQAKGWESGSCEGGGRRPLTCRALAPRVIGVRAGDALRALANQGFKTRLAGPLDGTVIRQKPQPGKPVSDHITLVAR